MLFAIQDMGVCENCGHVALLTLPNYWFQVVKTDGFCDFGKNKWSSPIIIHNHRYWAILRWGLWMLTIPYIPIWIINDNHIDSRIPSRPLHSHRLSSKTPWLSPTWRAANQKWPSPSIATGALTCIVTLTKLWKGATIYMTYFAIGITKFWGIYK